MPLEMTIEFDVQQGDVSARPTPFYDRSFHHVIMNPPYFAAESSSMSPDAGRASGRSEHVALSHWVAMAAKRLRPKGYLTVIQRAERLPDLLVALEGRLGSIVVQPLAPRAGRAGAFDPVTGAEIWTGRVSSSCRRRTCIRAPSM